MSETVVTDVFASVITVQYRSGFWFFEKMEIVNTIRNKMSKATVPPPYPKLKG